MRTITIVSALALMIATPWAHTAYAADVYSAGGSKGGAVVDASPANWTGFYFGANGGYGEGTSVSDPTLTGSATIPASGGSNIPFAGWLPGGTAAGSAPVAGATPGGFLFGGQMGYLYQPNNTGGIVIGTEFSFDGSSISGDHTSIVTGTGTFTPTGGTPVTGTTLLNTSSHQQLDYIGTLTGVVGISFGNAMPYLKGGFAFGQVQDTVGVGTPGNGLILSRTGFDTGWTGGAGLAYKVAPSWSIFAEYDYYDLGSHSLALDVNVPQGSTPAIPVHFATNSINEQFWGAKVGVNYQVGGNSYVPLK